MFTWAILPATSVIMFSDQQSFMAPDITIVHGEADIIIQGL